MKEGDKSSFSLSLPLSRSFSILSLFLFFRAVVGKRNFLIASARLAVGTQNEISLLKSFDLTWFHRSLTMSLIDGLILDDDRQQEAQQQSNVSALVAGLDTLSLSLGQMPEIHSTNLSSRYLNDSTTAFLHEPDFTSFTYKVIFGFVCACLCFLTITGNLLVLITFRRMRTVSMETNSCYRCLPFV